MSEENKKLSLPEQEEKILEFWERNKIFEKSVEQRRKSKRYVFYDGPPFATGLPHYGHILGSTVKDLVGRYWTMKGYLVERRWGWDCHGLPIENIVEEELKISGRKQIEQFGIKEFNETARSKVLTYVNEWSKTVKRIGRFVDFENSYKTMDATYMESVWWAFAELYKKGLIYKDARTSLFCTRCETPLSNFEIAMDNSYRDQEDDSVFVKLKLEDKENEYILIWTTTPWTLPGNAAVAVNPEITYTKFKMASGEFIWSANTPPHELGDTPEPIEKTLGEKLLGSRYQPLFKITDNHGVYKIVGANFVDAGEGTGLVHIAPAFGEDDFLLGKKENLPTLQTLDDSGRFNREYPEISFLFGKETGEASRIVIEHLKNTGELLKVQRIVHRYPICWRCSTPLIYKVQSAWFVKVAALKKQMLALNEKIDWHPDHLKHGRFGKGLEDAPDWNINRSRFWGTPVPIWECSGCKKIEVIGGREELYKKAVQAKNRYIFMRHGEAESNIKNIFSCKDQNIHPLTLNGRKQIEKSLVGLKKKKVDLIIASPFLRTRQTAEIVAESTGAEMIFDPRLSEISCGNLDGGPIEEYNKLIPRREDRVFAKPSGGENLTELRTRMFAVVEEVEKKYQNRNILIVSHEYPLWMLHSAMQGLSNKEALAARAGGWSLNNAECVEVEYHTVPRNDSGEVDFHRPYSDKISLDCSCGEKMERIKDVFDCWFESGSMPFAEKHYPFENKKVFEENFPADFISEYIAQTRGWFYTLHVLSTALFNKPAFKHEVTSGTILSEKGEKLSKSKKNFPDPWLLFDKYGVDAMRYYLMSSSVMLAENINFSEKEVDEVYKKFSLILYNVLGFYKLYEYKLPKNHDQKPKNFSHVLDKWVFSRLHSTIKEVTENLDNYEIVKATRPMLDFVQDLSLWYVRRSRERIKTYTPDGEDALLTLRYVLFEFSRLIAPVTPFLAEIVYKEISGAKESVHLEDWPEVNKKFIDKKIEEDMAEVRNIVSEALRLRAEAGIKVRQPLSKLQVASYKLQEKLELLGLIKDEVNVKEIIFGSEIKLDTTLTAELKDEGLVREFVRNVQGLRKDLGLKPQDVIVCQISGDEEIENIISRHSKDILKGIHAEEIKIGGKKEFKAEKEADFDGKKLWIGIK
ncbi:MAG: class I tRNA ligase family protein [bacterium]|nr:class I tRNA ligase family protein [bacterium]